MATHGAAPVSVGWSRFLIGAVAVLPFVPGVTWALFRDWRIWLRGLLLAVGITSIQLALREEPIADVFAAFFIGPIFSYFLSVIFLKEQVTRLRTALLAPLALNTVPVLTAPIVGLTLLSGLFSMGGNFLLLIAYRIAPATQMAPLIYFQLIAATILGWTVFADLPDIYTWIGLSLVIGSGIASALVRR